MKVEYIITIISLIAEIKSGESCTQEGQTTECVPNASCKNSKCTCNTGYYDNNFAVAGGTCVEGLLFCFN